MEKSTQRLMNGTFVYFLGNGFSQLLSLLLMRFITGNISASEYGIYNLVVTITNLVTPFITLQISDALFKYVISSDSREKTAKYYSFSLLITAISIVVNVVGVFVIHYFISPIPHPLLVLGYMVVHNIVILQQKMLRALQLNTVLVKLNLLRTFLFLTLQIFFIYVFHFQSEALFLAVIVSSMIFVVFAELKIKSYRIVQGAVIDKDIAKRMIKFSLPLVPNAVFWWMTSSVNSVIISAKLGLDINGIYFVANKFSNVLTIITSVFIMAWQESAILEYGSPDFKKFFSKTFSTYFVGLFSIVSVMLPFISIVFPYMIAPSYYESIQYAPVLLISSCLSTLAGFCSQIFAAQEKTQRNITTTAIGIFVNISIVFLCVDSLGLWAAALGTSLSNLIGLLVRMYLIRSDISAKNIKWVKMAIVALTTGIGVVLYFKADAILNLAWVVICAVVALMNNWALIKGMSKVVLSKLGIGKN